MIFTSYFSNKKIPSNLLKIRVSVGHARWALPYQLAGKLDCLMPDRAWFALSPEDYKVQYIAKLERIGIESIKKQLQAITAGADCVLLCFEKLQDEEAWCHRTIFAEWYFEKTGEKITELEF